MQTCSVFLDIYSDKISLAEMSSVLGGPDENISFERGGLLHIRTGKKKQRRRRNKIAMWRLESKVAETGRMDRHLKSLFRRAEAAARLARKRFGSTVKIALNIGLFFYVENAAGGTNLTAPLLEKFCRLVDSVDISAYPCSGKGPSVHSR
jgi:hypothetical protein